jgi:MFS family permease
MSAPDERLFTPRFFVMCGFTFTVFLSAFQLLPTAPYRIIELGGSTTRAGMFLGFLTYASALSAPLTGALADRTGKRRMLLVCSFVLAAFALGYGLSRDYRLTLLLALPHGVFWSGLLSASSAYMTDFIPESRRAEGISYWGLSTMLAVAVAPSLGFRLHQLGWPALCASAGLLNLVMAAIAWRLPETAVACHADRPRGAGRLVEWPVLGVALTLFLLSFGYGGLTSFVALYSDSRGIRPRSLFFTAFAISVLCTRPFSGPLADRIGPKRVLLPCLALAGAGLALVPLSTTRAMLIASAVVFGLGFGSAYPAFVAWLIRRVDARRRGAVFGAVLAAFDTGVGTGSIGLGWLVERFGFARGFAGAAAVAALAVPYFLFAERRFGAKLNAGGPRA